MCQLGFYAPNGYGIILHDSGDPEVCVCVLLLLLLPSPACLVADQTTRPLSLHVYHSRCS